MKKKWKSGDGTVFRIFLDTYGPNKTIREIHIVGGPRPYVWIGNDTDGCYGCIPDKWVRKFKDRLTKALRGT